MHQKSLQNCQCNYNNIVRSQQYENGFRKLYDYVIKSGNHQNV